MEERIEKKEHWIEKNGGVGDGMVLKGFLTKRRRRRLNVYISQTAIINFKNKPIRAIYVLLFISFYDNCIHNNHIFKKSSNLIRQLDHIINMQI